MNQPSTEPSLHAGAWALQLMHLLVVPTLLALALLSLSVLYVNWGPALPLAETSTASANSTAASASAPDIQSQRASNTEAAQRLDAALASLQAP